MKFRLITCLAMSLPLFISLPFGVSASEEWEQFGRSIPVPYNGYKIYSTDVSDDGQTVLAATASQTTTTGLNKRRSGFTIFKRANGFKEDRILSDLQELLER